MNLPAGIKALFVAASLSAMLVGCSADESEIAAPAVQRLDNEAPARILFVGNSYLYYNDSLHNHVLRIAHDIGPLGEGDYRFKSVTISGARLGHHDVEGLLEPGRLGIDEPFDLVVLQGGSMEVLSEESREAFREVLLEIADDVRDRGAELALYMTHAYVPPDARYEPELIEKIEKTYRPTGDEVDALVIPVGLAFERAYEQRPDIQLHKAFDGSHPSLLGTYLAACVVYQSVYGRSVTETSYDYFGAIDADDARFLRAVADETVRDFFRR